MPFRPHIIQGNNLIIHGEQPSLSFGNDSQIVELAKKYGTPLLVHDEDSYRRYAKSALNAPNAFGLTVRYAMKANSHRAILSIFDGMGIFIDASSYYEVKRAIAVGIAPERIKLTSQETLLPELVAELVSLGVVYNCTSLTQLRIFAELFRGSEKSISVRVNPGLGSGHNNRTNTAGPAASFGIWHDYVPEVLDIAKQHSLRIAQIHTHVGSGSDWRIWQKASHLTLDIVRKLPDVKIVNLGGGFKIDRLNSRNSIDINSVFQVIKDSFEKLFEETGRKLHLEIEPGTYLAANSCLLLSRINDIVDTGHHGHGFIKLDASMTELLRPMIYGARHPIRLLARGEDTTEIYVVVGNCCESGDIFTPKESNPDEIDSVQLPKAEIGDYIAVMGAGAYGISMSAKNYNSHPICAEVMLRSDGSHLLITQRQTLEEIWEREMPLD
ncbi:MAG: diaminopimelate decarboxylase [Candidatus Kryptoniota bacterium]